MGGAGGGGGGSGFASNFVCGLRNDVSATDSRHLSCLLCQWFSGFSVAGIAQPFSLNSDMSGSYSGLNSISASWLGLSLRADRRAVPIRCMAPDPSGVGGSSITWARAVALLREPGLLTGCGD